MGTQEEQRDTERRGYPRRLVCVATDVESLEQSKRVALIKNMSVSGAFLLARIDVLVGERLLLTLHLPDKREERVEEAAAEVMRVEPFPPERSDVWSCGIAVRFEEPLHELADVIDKLSALVERAGLKG